MAVFSRKPSREASLQKIYTEAYQSSLQSILKESSFDFRGSLDSWKQTLAQITAGMALLDGSPPRTGQEKSLLASIMDTERQCHDRINALEIRLERAKSSAGPHAASSNNPYGTHGSTPSTSVLNVNELSLSDKKKPQRVAVGSKSSPTKTVHASSEPVLKSGSSQRTTVVDPASTVPVGSTIPSNSSSPVFDFTDKFASTFMPKVNEMPYKLYSKKPVSPRIGSPVPSARSAPILSSEKTTSTKPTPAAKSKTSHKKEPVVQHRSSLDYPQPAPAVHSHSMLSTLRAKNPLKSRSRPQHTPTNSITRHSPSPRTSAENISTEHRQQQVQNPALSAAKQTAAAQQMAQAQHLAPPSHTPQRSESPSYIQFSGFEGAFRSDSQPSSPTFSSSPEFQSSSVFVSSPQIPQSSQTTAQSQPSANARQAASKTSQFQVAYEKVSTSSGRTTYRPRVVRTQIAAPQSQSQSRESSRPNSTSQRPRDTAMLANGRPENESNDPDFEQMDDWDRMVHEKIKDLRGVDKQAAKQIVNEVVLKGDQVTWDDIAGLEKAKASLKETVVYPFLRPDLFMGLREPVLGMLLFGPPGTGKTMLARAVATESKSTFFSISASSLTSKFMGESEKLVRALFQIAKALAPSIIFIDEIDSILTQRSDSGEHEASRRIKNEFLVQWSDLQAAAAGKSHDDAQVRRVLVLGATNLPWAIDEAARRRFVRRQYIPLPEPFTRKVHLQKLLSHQKHALTDQELDQLVELTDGYSGSDLTALAKDAAMGPLRSLGDALLTTAPDQIRPMGMNDFLDSMKSIRPSVSPEGLHAFEQWAEMYGSSGA